MAYPQAALAMQQLYQNRSVPKIKKGTMDQTINWSVGRREPMLSFGAVEVRTPAEGNWLKGLIVVGANWPKDWNQVPGVDQVVTRLRYDLYNVCRSTLDRRTCSPACFGRVPPGSARTRQNERGRQLKRLNRPKYAVLATAKKQIRQR